MSRTDERVRQHRVLVAFVAGVVKVEIHLIVDYLYIAALEQ